MSMFSFNAYIAFCYNEVTFLYLFNFLFAYDLADRLQPYLH